MSTQPTIDDLFTPVAEPTSAEEAQQQEEQRQAYLLYYQLELEKTIRWISEQPMQDQVFHTYINAYNDRRDAVGSYRSRRETLSHVREMIGRMLLGQKAIGYKG